MIFYRRRVLRIACVAIAMVGPVALHAMGVGCGGGDISHVVVLSHCMSTICTIPLYYTTFILSIYTRILCYVACIKVSEQILYTLCSLVCALLVCAGHRVDCSSFVILEC